MKNIVKITLVFLILLLTGCPEDKYPGTVLGVQNNSSSAVYFWYSSDYTIHHFPDISLPEAKPLYFTSVAANSGAGMGEDDPDWIDIYSQLPDGKFTVFVFSKDVVDNTPWETVRDDYLILERFDVTLEELKALDYTLTYSP